MQLVPILGKDVAFVPATAVHYAVYTPILDILMDKPDPDLQTADRLSRNNHAEDRDQEITDMNINVNAISTTVNTPVYTSTEDIQATRHEYTLPAELRLYIIHGWPHKKGELEHKHQALLAYKRKLAIIDSITMKCNRIIIPFLLQKQILQQLYSNHIGTEKMIL